MAFKDRLKEARLSRGLTQEQVAKQIGVAKSTFTGYEKGNSEPNMLTISKIMNVLKVDANFLWQDETNSLTGLVVSIDEKALLKKYRGLDDHGREIVDFILDKEHERYIASINEKPAALRMYTYMHKIAAAGNGFYFYDIPTETIEAPYKEGADFIIGVSGDSMEPTFYDGDKVYVKKASELDVGKIGIFLYNNECFIKEKGADCLISHNKKYPDMIPAYDVRLIGEVLGKIEED